MNVLSHRIALDPTPQQRIALAKAAGCARKAWNWGLGEWRQQYAAGGKPSGPALRKQWNAVKHALYPWMKESPKDANIEPLFDLEKAFKSFFTGKAKYPRFKAKGKDRPAFGVSNDKFRTDGKRVRLPVIGWVKMREALRFEGKVLSGRVTFQGGRWFLSVAVEAAHLRAAATAGTVGLDLGVETLAVLSDGVVIENSRALRSETKRLHRAQLSIARKRRARDKALGPAKKGERRPVGKNLQKACRKAARVHARVHAVRSDAIHKATTKIASSYSTVVVEDLNVEGMTRRAKGPGRAAKAALNRAILDAGFGEFRRQLTYKLPLHGGTLLVAPRFFASSKTCSRCGAVRKHLSLKERTFTCDSCGYVVHRDLNAAINLRTAGLAGRARRHGVSPEPGTPGAAIVERLGNQQEARNDRGGLTSAHVS